MNFLRVCAGCNAKLAGKLAAKKIVWHDIRLAERDARNRRRITKLKIQIQQDVFCFYFVMTVAPPAYIWIAD